MAFVEKITEDGDVYSCFLARRRIQKEKGYANFWLIPRRKVINHNRRGLPCLC